MSHFVSSGVDIFVPNWEDLKRSFRWITANRGVDLKQSFLSLRGNSRTLQRPESVHFRLLKAIPLSTVHLVLESQSQSNNRLQLSKTEWVISLLALVFSEPKMNVLDVSETDVFASFVWSNVYLTYVRTYTLTRFKHYEVNITYSMWLVRSFKICGEKWWVNKLTLQVKTVTWCVCKH